VNEMPALVVLVIDDDPADVVLIKDALGSVVNRPDIHVATDGWEAVQFLLRFGTFRDAPIPELILLDLNMPGKDGRKTLAEVKADRQLRRIPMIVLARHRIPTTSTAVTPRARTLT
jgi:CheY-like chemotaxis protein